METPNHIQEEEQRERGLAILRQMVARKRAYEKETIENYKSDPELQALIAKLIREKEELEKPVGHYTFIQLPGNTK